MDTTLKSVEMTPPEIELLKEIIEQEIDSVKVIGLQNPDQETPYTILLASLERRFAGA